MKSSGSQPAAEQHTSLPWEASGHAEPSSPKEWAYVKHNFPEAPYEGDLDDEWGIYPPLGEAGPVAIVSGEANAHFIVTACNAHEALVTALKWIAINCDGPAYAKARAALALARTESL